MLIYALFIFSAYAIPSLLLLGAILYDYRLLDASAFSFAIIGFLTVWSVLPIAGLCGIVFGCVLEGISLSGVELFEHKTININIKELVKHEMVKKR